MAHCRKVISGYQKDYHVRHREIRKVALEASLVTCICPACGELFKSSDLLTRHWKILGRCYVDSDYMIHFDDGANGL
jgi:hypothetical protein